MPVLRNISSSHRTAENGPLGIKCGHYQGFSLKGRCAVRFQQLRKAIEKRADKLSVLRNAEGFLLTLMYAKRMTPEQGYPGMFHVGFLQPTRHDVDLVR